MSDTPENEDEAEGQERRASYLLNAGELGVCFLLLSAMLAVPKQEWEWYLTSALVALAIAIPFSAAASGLYFFGYTGWLVEVISTVGHVTFCVALSGVFAHLNELVAIGGGIAFGTIALSYIIYLLVIFLRSRTRYFLRRVRKPRPQQARSVIQLVPSDAARNGAQRPPHSTLVQREMKYHRPIERSRADNRSDTYVSRGSHQVPPQG